MLKWLSFSLRASKDECTLWNKINNFLYHLPSTIPKNNFSVVSQFSFASYVEPRKSQRFFPLFPAHPKESDLGEGTNQASKPAEIYNKLDYTILKNTGNLSVEAWPKIKLDKGILICKLLVCFYQNFYQQDRSLIVQILNICTTQFKAVRNLTEYILVLQALPCF